MYLPTTSPNACGMCRWSSTSSCNAVMGNYERLGIIYKNWTKEVIIKAKDVISLLTHFYSSFLNKEGD